MKILETTSTKVLLGTAAASLVALGIVFVASSVPAPTIEHHEHANVRPLCNSVPKPPPPPMPVPQPEQPRPPASK